MRDPISKFCLLLAGADFTEKEIFSLLKRLQVSSAESLIKEIRNLKSISGYRDDTYDINEKSNFDKKSLEGAEAARLAKMLRDETGLGSREAYELLIMELKKNLFIRNELPIFPAKKSLKDAIERLADDIPLSELSAAVKRMRNRLHHSYIRNDWALKTPKDKG